jgi:hypothetical protein
MDLHNLYCAVELRFVDSGDDPSIFPLWTRGAKIGSVLLAGFSTRDLNIAFESRCSSWVARVASLGFSVTAGSMRSTKPSMAPGKRDFGARPCSFGGFDRAQAL